MNIKKRDIDSQNKPSLETEVLIFNFFEISANDNTIKMPHICIFLALINQSIHNPFQNPFTVTRDQIMGFARINSHATYHKCIKDLRDRGYINYYPSFHPMGHSKVSIAHGNLNAIEDSLLNKSHVIL